MSDKKAMATHIRPDSELMQDFEDFMDGHNLDTTSDGIRMAISHACKPYRDLEKTLNWLFGAVVMFASAYLIFSALVLAYPTPFLAEMALRCAQASILLGLLCMPGFLQIWNHRRKHRDVPLRTQLKQAVLNLAGVPDEVMGK